MNLDQRIGRILYESGVTVENRTARISFDKATPQIKQLIKDCLEYVKPDKLPVVEVVTEYKPGDLATFRGEPMFNRAVDEMEAKIKELGL